MRAIELPRTTLLFLFACGPQPLAVVPGAVSLSEQANGELLVGTDSGALFAVSSFGDLSEAGRVPAAPTSIVTDPLGRWHALLEDGRIFRGGIWTDPVQVAEGARLLVQGCEAPRWALRDDDTFEAGVTALGLATCDRLWIGDGAGAIDGQTVSGAPIRRLQSLEEGVLWLDAEGHAGCLGCTAPLPEEGVVDAVALHVVPFLAGELAWLDAGGAIWIAAD